MTLTSSPRRTSEVFAIACVGIVLANLDLFIVNIAIPSIAADFTDASLEDLSWVLNGYAIAYAALLVFFGRLSERYRRDRSFLLGIVIFTVASGGCAMAGGVWQLVGWRIAQAAGAALMTPTSLGLLLASFPSDRRASAVRNWAAVGGLAAAAGPLAGGLLVSGDWRWIFLVNVPIGLVAVVIAWWRLPAVPGHAAEPPSLGAALLVTGGVSALVFAIVKGPDWGWATPGILLSLSLAAVLIAMFVAHCLRSPNPFVDPKLFHVRQFTGAALALVPYSITFGALLLSVTLWSQSAWGWSALKAGLTFVPGPLCVPLASTLLVGRLSARFGPAFVVCLGIVSITIGFAIWATFISLEPSVSTVLIGMIFNGLGVGLAFPTLMGVGTQTLPPSSFATGSGVINMLRQAAMAVGVAIFVAIVGSPATPVDRLAAFQLGWWVMAAITAMTLVPTVLIRAKVERPSQRGVTSSGRGNGSR